VRHTMMNGLEYLQRSQLKSIVLDSQTLALQFRFTQVEGKPDTILELLGIAQINLAKDLDDEEMLAMVGEASLVPIADGGRAVFERLHYPFKSLDDHNAPFSYPGVQLFHFHMEGDICADVICKEYRLREVAAS
jgi:hypothetical protein